ncbi:MAG: hypothetical protein MZV70_62830 [Desulfobacterales bacterium]|nr:hypothetical protein [Desulfobacterales bacterium]
MDTRRIFVTGFSNGASMAFRVGAELSGRVAAIAPVAGACWLDKVRLQRPVPMCYITGTDDPLNLIEGGVPRLAIGGSDKVRGEVQAARARLHPEMGQGHWQSDDTIERVFEADGVRIETYGPGRDGAEVIYVTVQGLGHTWPGGKSLLPEPMVGKRPDKLKATDAIWEFFEKHTPPERR